MHKLDDIFVSVVLVADEHINDADKQVEKITNILKKSYTNYELLVIDNGFREPELDAIKNLLVKVPCVRVIRLSRNHDIDTAVFAGVEAAIGDYICVLYGKDPVDLVPDFIAANQTADLVFGIARNLKRQGVIEQLGAKLFYWYSRRFMQIHIPRGSTYFMSMNRTAANALTRSGRFMRHIRHMAKRVGFRSVNFEYDLPEENRIYTHVKAGTLWTRAIDLVSNYSSHPLRVVTYFGMLAGLLNVVYAVYVVIINLSSHDVAKGWTTLSLQASVMFFILFLIMALLAEYIGKILNETQQEPPYHIMQELSSTISIADETRRNVTR